MRFFGGKNKSNNYYVIVGCGRLGASLATSVSENDDNVLVIDSNKDSFRKLSTSFGGLTVTGNASNLDVLSQAQINSNTTIICVTNSDNTNIMIAQMAKELFAASKVVVRLYDPEKAIVYSKQNIDTICPASLSAKEISILLNDNKHKEEALI